MTITSTSNKITYTGSGTTGPFTYNFKIFEDTDLEVTKYTIADGTSETLALTTDYTVTGAGDDAGGTITLVASLSSSYRLIIRRVLPITQEIDYIANDPFPAASHEEALDRSTMINQQQQEQLDRAVLVPVGTTTDPEDLLAQIEANAATAEAAADTASAAVGSAIYLWGATVGGTADAITLTPSPAILLYSAGMRFAFLATGNNTGATTVNISGLGVKTVKTLLGAALAAGDITSGNVYSMTYDGTDFRLHESPKVLPTANGGTGSSANANAASGVVVLNGSSQLTADVSAAIVSDNISQDGKPICRLYGDGTPTIVNNTATKISYSSATIDTTSAWNGSTKRYVPLVAGYYRVSQYVDYAAPTEAHKYSSSILKNGSSAISCDATTSATYSGANCGVMATGIVQLNGSTDYLEFYTTNNSFGGESIALTGASFATIELI